MDHKTWLWKKRSTDKTIVAADKVNLSLGGHEEEIQTLLNDKAVLERDLKNLGEKLSLVLAESNDKDGTIRKQEKMAQEAIAGWEKAEAEATSLKKALDKAIQHRVAGEERVVCLDAALKECMQQLRFVREEQEKRIHDAMMKTSSKFEKTIIVLEEKLAETNKRLSKLGSENSQLSKALLAKEKVIEDLKGHRARAEADFITLMTRLESMEKESASLKYEVRVLEKELEIRNEEREFNRRTADVAHKQHLESAKKIAKLESECQRLRVLVRKRLPGPAAMAKMRSEVEMLGRDPTRTRRKLISTTGSMDFAINAPDTPSRRINFLTEQLYLMEEENRAIKETLSRKTNEPSLASVSDMGSEGKVGGSESWASALISELEHFKNGKQSDTPSCKTVGASDINLMDDFVEMEKLAIVSVDCQSDHFVSNPEIQPENMLIGNNVSSAKKSNQQVQLDASKSIHKIIELIDGISLPSPEYVNNDSLIPYKNSEMPGDYTVRVFQWKSSDLNVVLQKFVQTCYDLLNGKADLEKFAEELTSSLEWLMNHCFSLQDVSSMREAIKKQFDWDESRSESEVEGGIINHLSEVREENRRLRDELVHIESANKDLEGRLQLEIGKSESLMIQLQESEKTVSLIQDQMENHMMAKEDLDRQLKMVKVELNEARQNLLSQEEELENKNNCCEELEATCIDLQLQLESLTNKEIPNCDMEEEEKQLQNDLEITAASEKLAECQETILNLGKQLQALSSPRDTTLFDKFNSTLSDQIPTTTSPKKNLVSQRSSLLHKMLAEDNAKIGDLNSPQTKEVICTSKSLTLVDDNSQERLLNFYGIKDQDEEVVANPLAIVPSKKTGGGRLLKKLLWRRKKRNSNKIPFPFAG